MEDIFGTFKREMICWKDRPHLHAWKRIESPCVDCFLGVVVDKLHCVSYIYEGVGLLQSVARSSDADEGGTLQHIQEEADWNNDGVLD